MPPQPQIGGFAESHEMDVLWNCKALDNLWSDDRMIKLKGILKTSDRQAFVGKQLTRVSWEMQVLMLWIWVGPKVLHLSRPPGPAESAGQGSTCRVSRLSSTWSLGQKINTLSFWRGLGDPEREASGHGTITSRAETNERSCCLRQCHVTFCICLQLPSLELLHGAQQFAKGPSVSYFLFHLPARDHKGGNDSSCPHYSC